MFCKSCGKKIQTTSPSCPHCGRATDAMSGGTGFWDLTTRQSSANTTKDSAQVKSTISGESVNAQTKPGAAEEKVPPTRVETAPRGGKHGLFVGVLLILVIGLQVCLLLRTGSLQEKVDFLQEQVSLNQSALLQELAPDQPEPAAVEETPATEDPAVMPGQPSPMPAEYPPVGMELPQPEQPDQSEELDAKISFYDTNTLVIKALLPEDVEARCADNPESIKWWVSEGNGHVDILDDGYRQRTGDEIYYAVADANGNPEKYLYYEVDEIQSKRIYLLRSVVTIERREDKLIPEGVDKIEAKCIPGEELIKEWQRCSKETADDPDATWEPYEPTYSEVPGASETPESLNLKLTELDTDQYRYRYVVKNKSDVIIAIAEYNP